jgi:hypothetical protein
MRGYTVYGGDFVGECLQLVATPHGYLRLRIVLIRVVRALLP